jgi:hypothetical protein
VNPESPTAQEVRQQLTQAIKGSNEVLARATTAFKIFADTLTIDRAKLTVTKRQFWRMVEVTSIRIEDVLNVTATVGPLLGSVTFSSRVFNNQIPYTVAGFWRDDALRLKRIAQGYIIARQRNIDCASLPISELTAMLDKLGEDSHPPK